MVTAKLDVSGNFIDVRINWDTAKKLIEGLRHVVALANELTNDTNRITSNSTLASENSSINEVEELLHIMQRAV